MKKNPSNTTARTPQSQEVSIPTPTGSMTATTQPSSCTKGMHMKFTLIVFQHGDWRKVYEFDTQAEAEHFVDAHPRFGGDLSKAIRQGNWQVIQTKETA